MSKTEVDKMYFVKQMFLLFIVNQKKLLVVSGKGLEKFQNRFTFNTNFQVFSSKILFRF